MFFNRIFPGLILTAAMLFKVVLCQAQAYSFQHISMEKGLPQSQAFAIAFDQRQYAWIGTQGGGLCRYDGSEFVSYTRADSLISNRIFSLKIIGNEIWIGQRGGVTVFTDEGEFIRNYRLMPDSRQVNEIIQFENKIILATDLGPMELKGEVFTPSAENVTIAGTTVNSFFVDGKNDLWLCTNSGLLNYKDPFKKQTNAKGLSKNQVTCAIRVDSLWIIGTFAGGLNFYVEGENEIKQYETLAELNDEIILSLHYAQAGELWIGTMNSGVFVYSVQSGALKNYQASNGLANNHVRTIVSDYWENIWIGTSGGGISVYQSSPFIEYNTLSGLNGNYVYAVLNDNRNNLWIGTEGTGVLRINDTSSVIFDEEYGFFSSKVKSIFQDDVGDIWFGTEGDGLGIFSQYDGKDTIYTFAQQGGIGTNWIKCFSQDPVTGVIYIGTYGSGVYQVRKDWQFPLVLKAKRYKPEGAEIPDDISDLNFINGRLWFTSRDGVYGYVQGEKVTLNEKTGMNYRSVVGHENMVWIATADNGVLRVVIEEDGMVEKDWVTASTYISSNSVYQLILADKNLWIGTEKGLDRVELDSNWIVQSSEHFGFEEGFEGIETNINAVHKDHDGNLWFGTVNGLYAYKGGEVNYASRKPPFLSFTDFNLFYESIEQTEFADFYHQGEMIKYLILPYNMNNVGFSFKAIHYTYGKKIRYRWKLEGAEDNWSPSTTLTTANYSNLAPGNYTFRVMASFDDEVWQDIPEISLSFSVDTPYWDKWWFKAGYYGLIVIVVALIVLVIVQRSRRKHRDLAEKFQLEKNLLELEQKALRLQMNPHFIFNVLTSIHNLIILNETDKARYALSKFSKLMRRVLENSREKFISIDDEIETLENYVQLEKLTGNLDIDFNIEVDENLDAAEEILPPLLLQPFVENAIIHGLKELDRPGKIIVSFVLEHDHLLRCTVEDNGRGRDSAGEIVAQKEQYHKSTALNVTQERLASLNKTSQFKPFEIIDLVDEQNVASGTRIVIRIEI